MIDFFKTNRAAIILAATLFAAGILAHTTPLIAANTDTKAPKYCTALIDIMSINLNQLVQGSSDVRVEIAQDAHHRLRCNPTELLDVLQIKL